ncbi:MAG: TIR domain-containing protein [Terriglobia bacterium]
MGQNENAGAGLRRDTPVGGRRAGSVFRSRDRRPITPARLRQHRQPQRAGIRHYDKLVVICSKNSLQSLPVIREIERALQKQDREHNNVLFPIRIDDYLFDKWDHPPQGRCGEQSGKEIENRQGYRHGLA